MFMCELYIYIYIYYGRLKAHTCKPKTTLGLSGGQWWSRWNTNNDLLKIFKRPSKGRCLEKRRTWVPHCNGTRKKYHPKFFSSFFFFFGLSTSTSKLKNRKLKNFHNNTGLDFVESENHKGWNVAVSLGYGVSNCTRFWFCTVSLAVSLIAWWWVIELKRKWGSFLAM